MRDRNLVVASVLSGNRNFEGRIQQDVRANYLASPPLVVAYALAGRMNVDLTTEPLGTGTDGKPVYLRDIWPTEHEIQAAMLASVDAGDVPQQYASVFDGDERWRALPGADGRALRVGRAVDLHPQAAISRRAHAGARAALGIVGARVLAAARRQHHDGPHFAGRVDPADSPAGKYLIAHGVQPKEFNSYGARRGNHEVMMRGTFANIRLRNQIAPGTEGGWTTWLPSGELMTIYDASMKYQEAGVPLLVIAGKEYGSGSSRDWAAKGTLLLGVKAVIAESFERIHRSNLVNMGVLPLQFKAGDSAASLNLTGLESLRSGGRGFRSERRVRCHGAGDLGGRIAEGVQPQGAD